MPPEIKTDRLILRPADVAEAGALFDLVTGSLPELTPWLPWARNYDSVAAIGWCRGGIDGRAAGTRFQYSIFIDGGVLIGDVTLFPKTDPIRGGEVGWWLGTPFVGRGFMTEAVRAITRAAGANGFDRMFVRVDPGNLRSRGVAERCEFRFERSLSDGGSTTQSEAKDPSVYGILDR